MKLPHLKRGIIKDRYKRFFADVELPNGEVVVAHCPNTGAMTSCWKPGAPAEISHSNDPKRKLEWTLELVDMGAGWVGVNTNRVNAIVADAVKNQKIECLKGYATQDREPRFEVEGFENSRFDLLLKGHAYQPYAYVEIKNATLLDGDTIRFPDAVTERGLKHLHLLREVIDQGFRAVLIFAVNRPEGDWFEPAWDIDPEYSATLEEVAEAGVEVVAARLSHHKHSVEVTGTNVWTPQLW